MMQRRDLLLLIALWTPAFCFVAPLGRRVSSNALPSQRGLIPKAANDAEVRRILEERNRKKLRDAGAAPPPSRSGEKPRGGGAASKAPPQSIFRGSTDVRKDVSGVLKNDATVGKYFGAYEVAHRLGASTASWGVVSNGWSRLKKKKKRRSDQFGSDDAAEALRTLTQGGVELVETASGSVGARVLSKIIKEDNIKVKVAARMAPGWYSRLLGVVFQGWARKDGVTTKKMNGEVDLLLVGPFSGGFLRPYLLPKSGSFSDWDAAKGGDDEVGVANIRGGRALRQAHRALEKRGLKLVAAAVSFSLIDSRALRDGTFKAAEDLDITILARSPLAAGLCSGKCTAENPTGGYGFGAAPKWRYRTLRSLKPLHASLEEVAADASSRLNIAVTPTQVALAWCIAKGAVPMPSIKTKLHAAEVAGCKGWELTDDEVDKLDANRPKKIPSFPMLPGSNA